MGNFSIMEDANDVAVALARTGAFFSNNQAPLTSRTVRFISGIHLPPGVMNQPPADLYGIENTNRGCTLSAELEGNGFKPAKPVSGVKALGIMTGKKDTNDSDPNTVNPAGIPIYRGNVLVGGIGVTGVPIDLAEYAAFRGATSTDSAIFSLICHRRGRFFLGGVVLPAIDHTSPPAGAGTGTATGGTWFVAATDGTGTPAEGDLVTPAAGRVDCLQRMWHDSGKCRSGSEPDARSNSAARRFAGEDGDRCCGPGWQNHWASAYAGFYRVQHRCGGNEGAEYGVLQWQYAAWRRFESGPGRNGRNQPYYQLWCDAAVSSGN